MLFKAQKGSLTGLKKPTVSAAFFILFFFSVHTYCLNTSGGQTDVVLLFNKVMGVPDGTRKSILSYEIGFWIFHRIGIGTATLERLDKPATYMVTLEAHPVGVFAKLVKRKLIFQTLMEFDKERNRMRPLSSSQKRIKDKETRDKTIKFDYEKGVCIFEYRKNGILEKEKTIPIPSEIATEDPVTAFHNICNGAYGEVNEDFSHDIKVIVKEKPTDLTFKVCPTNSKNEFTLNKDTEENIGFIAKINVAPELVDSAKGELFVCFSRDAIPLEIKVKDVIGFGDLYGRLVNKVTR